MSSAVVNTPSTNKEQKRKSKTKSSGLIELPNLSRSKKSKGKERQQNESLVALLDRGLSSDEEDLPPPNETLVPSGSVYLTEVVDGDEFHYDSLKDNDDLEIWVMRVPVTVKPRYLARLTLTEPPTHATTSQKIGSLSRKTGTYDVWSVRASDSIAEGNGDDIDGMNAGSIVGGEELLGMNVLLPRKKGGRLFVSPKPITHHLILTAQATLPTPPATPDPDPTGDAQDASTHMYKSPARYEHPKYLLKHRFMPTGAGLRGPPASVPALPSAPSVDSAETRDSEGQSGLATSTECNVLVGEKPEEREKEEDEVVEQSSKQCKHKEKKKKGKKPKAESGLGSKDEEYQPSSQPLKKRKAEGEGKRPKKAKTE